MLITMEDDDFAALARGGAPHGLRLPDTALAPPTVLEMLRGLAVSIRAEFTPAAWMIVDGDEIVGLCSVVRAPADGIVEIGYGIAPSRAGQGHAGRALADLLAWARSDIRVTAIVAETSPANLPSQKALSRNGFAQTGRRTDAEDGEVICWRIPVRSNTGAVATGQTAAAMGGLTGCSIQG